MYRAYGLGRRDAAAEILMRVRLQGVSSAIRSVADELYQLDKNPHAKWVLDTVRA